MKFESIDIITEEKEINLAKSFNDSILDLNIKPDRPPLAISIGLDDVSYGGVHYPLRFGTYGNLSMIKGEEKSRKSFLRSLILANTIGGKANNFTGSLEIQGHNVMNKYIFDLDSEQGDYDAWLNGIRIPTMVGNNYDFYKYVTMRGFTSKERLQLLEWLFNESEYKDNLGVVCIDGFVDFVEDFNSLTECKGFVENLMKWSKDTKSHVTGVLHLNPGSDKARGHLGTLLQQKCETVVIIKDMGDYSLVKQQRSRGKRFKDFTIRVDENWMPYISDDKEQEIELT